MQPDEKVRGYILQAFQQTGEKNGREPAILLSGRLENGETFAAVETRQKPILHIRTSDMARARPAGGFTTDSEADRGFRTMDGEAVFTVTSRTTAARAHLRASLHEAGIRTYEADISPVRRYLMDRGIHCSVSITGAWNPGRAVHRVYMDPLIEPSGWEPQLTILSFDIETDIRTNMVLAASYSLSPSIAGGPRIRGVLLQRENEPERETDRCGIRFGFYSCEKDLLQGFVSVIRNLDPDIVTGWNILDFDLPVLQARCGSNNVQFTLGRSDRASTFTVAGNDPDHPYPAIGRQVLDALRLSRIALKGMDDYKLETVARAVTGRTKLITGASGEERALEILRLYRDDIIALGEYCLTDADLVLDILEKEKLVDLTVRKSLLIGLPMDQVWKSVVSFEFLYMEELHKRNVVAPTRGIDQEPLQAAPGGGIITPVPGLHENVLVFDFKSLYPSIMRTFNIDPLSHAAAHVRGNERSGGNGLIQAHPIKAPNGAEFDRQPGILPEILDGFTKRREQARKEKNEAAGYAYKIVMNSFYGVLGTEGCRFASQKLAGAITEFGRTILFRTRDLLSSQGYSVLYGDTDSVFLLSGFPNDSPPDEVIRAGETLAAVVNSEIGTYIRETWNVESKLEIEFEKYYRRFYLPALRNVSPSDEVRGRAKGYAGLLVGQDGGESLDITGMEAVRHDWTDLARNFQKRLLSMVFHDNPEEEIAAYIQGVIREVLSGRLDQELIYRKSLRKPVNAYTKTMPPHVRAAAMLPESERQGKIEYFWTLSGPEPARSRKSPIDYNHYIEKQLEPIAESLAGAAGFAVSHLFSPGGQLELF